MKHTVMICNKMLVLVTWWGFTSLPAGWLRT